VNTSVFHRRRAERLAQLLDESSGGPAHHSRSAHDPELAGYVRLSDTLTAAAGVLPGPGREFRTGLRAMLVATAERDGIGTTAVPERDPEYGSRRARVAPPLVARGRAKGAILVGLAAGTLALSGMSAASGNAMPGDPLYSVKRSTESARLALAGSDVGRGQLYLEFARNRLAEAQSMGPHGADLSGMLDDMDADTRNGVRLLTSAAMDKHDRTGLDVIDAFVPQQRADLTALGNSARIRQSQALLDQIARRSADLRPGLGCASGAAAPDELGATPQQCTGTGTVRPSGSLPHPEATTTGVTGTTNPGTTRSPSPTASPSGLLGDLGRILGGGH